MIQVIAFSFNRAMQLDTLLASLFAHWQSEDYCVDVIYNHSNAEFGAGYKVLAENYANKPVTFYKENTAMPDKVKIKNLLCLANFVRYIKQPKLRHPRSDFKSLLIRLVEESNAENIIFLTDDDMFVKDFTISQNILDWINERPMERQFSLRCGKGISSLPLSVSVKGDYCSWNMYENQGHWGYPFTLDAHIYSKKIILQLIKKYIYTNPNTLEMNVVGSVRRAKLLGEGMCYKEIKMLNFPINIVQDCVENVSQDVSVEMLNKRYLKGEKLEYVPDEYYNANDQYTTLLKFIDASGKVELVEIGTEKNTSIDLLKGGNKNNKDDIEIIVAGDYSPKERVQKAIDSNKWQMLFPGVKELIQQADYSIVNFESTIAEKGDQPIDKIGCHLKTSYPSMWVLKQLGFNMITLANNHSMDYGENALYRTIGEAEVMGIDHVGAGKNLNDAKQAKFVTIKNKCFAIINCCEHEFSIALNNYAGANPLNTIDIFNRIKEVKNHSDYIILVIHGGIEHYQLPSPRMVELYRYFVDCGADAVINHHQHCFSGYEIYKGKPVVYGIGNFCFDSDSDIHLRHETFNYGYLSRLIFKNNGSIVFEPIPYEQCYKKPGVFLINEKDAFNKRIMELNNIIADDDKLKREFQLMANIKRKYYKGLLRPYNSRILKSLNSRGLFPSMINEVNVKSLNAMINCESHLDVIKESLKK